MSNRTDCRRLLPEASPLWYTAPWRPSMRSLAATWLRLQLWRQQMDAWWRAMYGRPVG